MTNAEKNIYRPRTLTRIASVQALFQWDQDSECSMTTLIEQFLLYRCSNKKCNKNDYEDGKTRIPNIELFRCVVEHFYLNRKKIDEAIVKVLPKDWPFERIDPIVRSILRSATAEMIFHEQNPPTAVIINEYLDVTHAFCEGDESTLINGVLNRLGKEVRLCLD
ncbi:Transcription antitermination protein NusB [Commensalibacter sp. Nvir]|uniref:transcription antitermination factor NusB n=1 Tax=Commensalibacter sp. Nvir TaxID=3069817 RepID=UPI002D42A601|nr:Transcription antitermination protein NusB [Commensalibacter sp. Nvir]